MSELEADPYAAPSAEIIAPVAEFGAEKDKLLCRDGAVLPRRCIKTNEPVRADQMHTETFKWARTGRLFSAKLVVCYGMSAPVRFRWAQFRLVSKIACWLGIGVLWLAIWQQWFWLFYVASVLLVASGVISAVGGQALKIVGRKAGGEFVLRGCCEEFLDSLAREPQRGTG